MQVLDPEAVVKVEKSAIEIATTRAAQEVQAAMLVAKRFPRDVNAAYTRIMQGCKRKALAEQSAYAYPRGGTKVTGPSIRLAEHLAQNWGNFESGVIELERKDGESIAMAYGWDLETNSRDVKIFTVEHIRERSAGKGGNAILTDPRDVYELVANQGARRKRACILALIPGDIVDAAEAECDKTLKGDNSEPLVDRVRKMAAKFLDLSITVEMIEKRLGHTLDSTNENELVSMGKIFISLRDGMSKREDWFPTDPTDQPTGKSGFGFKKAENDTAKTDPPKAEEQKKAPEPSLEDEARARELAESQPERGTETREQLLAEIDQLHSNRRDGAATRSGLWKAKCGAEPRGSVGIEKLRALRDHLRTVGGAQGTLA